MRQVEQFAQERGKEPLVVVDRLPPAEDQARLFRLQDRGGAARGGGGVQPFGLHVQRLVGAHFVGLRQRGARGGRPGRDGQNRAPGQLLARLQRFLQRVAVVRAEHHLDAREISALPSAPGWMRAVVEGTSLTQTAIFMSVPRPVDPVCASC